jgi:hypothetical protein
MNVHHFVGHSYPNREARVNGRAFTRAQTHVPPCCYNLRSTWVCGACAQVCWHTWRSMTW